jgi:hypothetical protein
MQQFFAYRFFSDLQMLMACRNVFFPETSEPIPTQRLGYFKNTVQSLKAQAEALGFKAVEKELEHAIMLVQFHINTPVTGHKARAAVDSINRHVNEALRDGAMLFLDPDKASWYSPLNPEIAYPNDKPKWESRQIDPKVQAAFPSAIGDLVAAGNCYATGNDTASVFHMMRAVEFGLRTLAEAVGAPVAKLPFEYEEWNTLINNVDSTWKASVDTWGKSAELINARQFFKRIVADLHAFKDDVRNIIMHTRGEYDSPGALSVRNRVDGWFGVLASKAHENMTSGDLLDRRLFVT